MYVTGNSACAVAGGQEWGPTVLSNVGCVFICPLASVRLNLLPAGQHQAGQQPPESTAGRRGQQVLLILGLFLHLLLLPEPLLHQICFP